jgi:hypothetical protein
MTDPVPASSRAAPPYGHATFYVDVHHRRTTNTLPQPYSYEVITDFDGVPDKVAYVDSDNVIVQYGHKASDGTISYGPQTQLNIHDGCLSNQEVLFDVDFDRQWDHFAFGAYAGKVYLMADTSRMMEDFALKNGDVIPADGKMRVDVNGDDQLDDLVRVDGDDADSALEYACKAQRRYTSDVKCMVDYISPDDRGIGTVYIEQQWAE